MSRRLIWFVAAAAFLASAGQACADDWQSLFDGKSLSGWKSYKSATIGDAWVIDNGTLHLSHRGGGDIITEQTWADFEFEFEWKISEGGNSGVMYRVRVGDKAPYMSGPEYQLLDDGRHRDGKNPNTASASLYAMIAPTGRKLNPVGEWNSAKIVLRNNQLQHWVNGVKVVETTMGDDTWEAMVKDSKFKTWPQFGKSARGHLCLQDHGDKVWFRNLRIRELN
jgi:3-keto-disaccharide hydrolase